MVRQDSGGKRPMKIAAGVPILGNKHQDLDRQFQVLWANGLDILAACQLEPYSAPRVPSECTTNRIR